MHIQQPGIEQYAVALHGEQHVRNRNFDIAVDMQQLAIAFDTRKQRLMQLQCDVGVLGGVFAGALDGHLFEADAVRTLAGHFVVADGFDAQMAIGEAVHIVRQVAFQHVGLQQGIVLDAGEQYAVVGKNMLVVLQILSEFAP